MFRNDVIKVQPFQSNATRFKKLTILGGGNFGTVWKVLDLHTNQHYALKEQTFSKTNRVSLLHQQEILSTLHKVTCVPRILAFWENKDCHCLVTQMMGKSIGTIFRQQKGFSIRTIQLIGYHMINIIEKVHSKNILHQDIKPDNILVDSKIQRELFLCDFGISTFYQPALVGCKNSGFVGTPRFASIAAHKELYQTKRDDLESLGYTLVFLAKQKLPWMNIKGSPYRRNHLILQQKLKTPYSRLCKGLPPGFVHYFQTLKSQNPQSQPNYKKLKCFMSKTEPLDEFDWVKTNRKARVYTDSEIKKFDLNTTKLRVTIRPYEEEELKEEGEIQGVAEKMQMLGRGVIPRSNMFSEVKKEWLQVQIGTISSDF